MALVPHLLLPGIPIRSIESSRHSLCVYTHAILSPTDLGKTCHNQAHVSRNLSSVDDLPQRYYSPIKITGTCLLLPEEGVTLNLPIRTLYMKGGTSSVEEHLLLQALHTKSSCLSASLQAEGPSAF